MPLLVDTNLVGRTSHHRPRRTSRWLCMSRFVTVLPARYDLEATLNELTPSVTSVLGLCGSGITMAEVGGCAS
jgi:hypothetical protein